MAHFKFEGDIASLSPRQIEYISNILEGRGFKNEKVLVEVVGKAGDNYVANVKRIIVERDGEIFKMIAKLAPTLEALRMMANSMIIFKNEHVMFTEVLPKFEELQRAADIPKEERIRYPQCYGSLLESPNEVILLEDLQVSNFVMLDRFVSLTDDSVKLAMKNIAILHSLSFVLKKQEPGTYDYFSSKLVNTWDLMGQTEWAKNFFEQMEQQILFVVHDEYKPLFKGAFTEEMNKSGKLFKIAQDSKYSIIQHGDAWTNNLMFRLEDGKSVECCMIDYQQSKEISPVIDIQYLIFNCTDYETRSNHYNKWIDYYHSELDKSLNNFGLKANFIYPRDQLDADLKRFGKMSFGLSAMLASVMEIAPSDAVKMKEVLGRGDLDNMAIANIMTEATSLIKYKQRLEGLAKSFLELGFLKSEFQTYN